MASMSELTIKPTLGQKNRLTLMLQILGLSTLVGAFTLAPKVIAQESGVDLLFRSASEGGARRFTVREETNLFIAPSETSEKMVALKPSTLLTNLGCEKAGDDLWCKVSQKKKSEVGFVPAKDVAPAKGPDGVIAIGLDDSKRRAQRRDFDANQNIACAQNVGEALARCLASIARSGGGDATIVVTFPNNFSRELYFTHGAFMRANSTMSGVGRDTDWELADGIYFIRVDDQRFEVEADFVLGP